MSPNVELTSTNKFLWRAAIYWVLSVFVGIGGMVIMPNMRMQQSSLEKNYELIFRNNKLLQENSAYLTELKAEVKRLASTTKHSNEMIEAELKIE